MMSIGQSRAQMVHLMQRSSSRRNMPRKRCAGSQRSSGYCTVTFSRNRCLKVSPNPAKRSRGMILPRNRFMALIEISVSEQELDQTHQRWPEELHQTCQGQIGESDGEQPLPSQLHELIEPVAREGATEPDVDEEEDEDLEGEPNHARDHVEEREVLREGWQPASQEHGRGHRRDDDHVGVLAKKKQGE